MQTRNRPPYAQIAQIALRNPHWFSVLENRFIKYRWNTEGKTLQTREEAEKEYGMKKHEFNQALHAIVKIVEEKMGVMLPSAVALMDVSTEKKFSAIGKKRGPYKKRNVTTDDDAEQKMDLAPYPTEEEVFGNDPQEEPSNVSYFETLDNVLAAALMCYGFEFLRVQDSETDRYKKSTVISGDPERYKELLEIYDNNELMVEPQTYNKHIRNIMWEIKELKRQDDERREHDRYAANPRRY